MRFLLKQTLINLWHMITATWQIRLFPLCVSISHSSQIHPYIIFIIATHAVKANTQVNTEISLCNWFVYNLAIWMSAISLYFYMSWRACVVCVCVMCVCGVCVSVCACVCVCVRRVCVSCVCVFIQGMEGCKGSAYQSTCLMGVCYSLCWRCEGGRGERRGRDGGRKWQTNLSSMCHVPIIA